MLLLLFTLIGGRWVDLVAGHSWMSCPRPFNTNPSRGGHLQPPCERFYRGAKTSLNAGKGSSIFFDGREYEGSWGGVVRKNFEKI